jgi:hypothetical protein
VEHKITRIKNINIFLVYHQQRPIPRLHPLERVLQFIESQPHFWLGAREPIDVHASSSHNLLEQVLLASHILYNK